MRAQHGSHAQRFNSGRCLLLSALPRLGAALKKALRSPTSITNRVTSRNLATEIAVRCNRLIYVRIGTPTTTPYRLSPAPENAETVCAPFSLLNLSVAVVIRIVSVDIRLLAHCRLNSSIIFLNFSTNPAGRKVARADFGLLCVRGG
jgi:hypothetical protein